MRMKKIMPILDPSMEDLPEPVMVDILSRLSVKTIIHCKCVCKKWLDLVSDSYFVDLHFSRSPESLMIHCEDTSGNLKPGILKWVEDENESESDHHYVQHVVVMSLDLNLVPIFQQSEIIFVGSVNGLLCLSHPFLTTQITYICNPITRESMILPWQQYYKERFASIVLCFGVASLTHEYKAICIFQGDDIPYGASHPKLLKAEVYTLGTGQWRSIGHVPFRLDDISGLFLNGHGHWIVDDLDYPEKICAFDFDKETFSLLSAPPFESIHQSLGVLKGCLCRFDTYDVELRLWVMKEYGIKKSWHKELVIKRSIIPDLYSMAMGFPYIITGLKDGTILMGSYDDKLLAYCPRRNTIVDMKISDAYFNGLTYRPSFHRLNNFENERVYVF